MTTDPGAGAAASLRLYLWASTGPIRARALQTAT